jgi:hypothetical protein
MPTLSEAIDKEATKSCEENRLRRSMVEVLGKNIKKLNNFEKSSLK